MIREYPNSKIVITGHTDNVGDENRNMLLSQQLATKVSKFLTEINGISADRLYVDGEGEQSPVASNDTDEGRTANRRVEIYILN